MIDNIISVEILDLNEDTFGYAAVEQYMMHGPCGTASPKSPCMKDKRCSKRFPKKLTNETIINDGGFPIYWRRPSQNILVEKNGIKLDNGYIVPYDRSLIVKYQAHINVEWCNRGRSIKYLFKYINKGPDYVSASLKTNVNSNAATTSENRKLDEVRYYLDCRYISAPEAVWRIFGFDIHYRIPAVERLPFHLPEQQQIIFKDTDNLEDIVNDIDSKQTKFKGWMEANKIYPEAHELTYFEFPSKFVWKADSKEWKLRKKGRSVGRIVYAHPSSGERFYLRLLLNVVKGATSFEDMRTHEGILYDTFKEKCAALRLLADDNEWQYAIDESSHYCSGQQMRHLFAQVLLFCEVLNPKKLWENNRKNMAEGILEMQRKLLKMPNLNMSEQDLQCHTLLEIQYLLLQNGQCMSKYHGMPLLDPYLMQQCKNKIISEELNFDGEELKREHEKYFQGLNNQQRIVYNTVTESVYNKTGGLYFVYGHGGTGKTYVWKSIIMKLRSEGKIVLVVASSGIASILLPNGRRAHSRFKIPIKLKESSTCGIKQGSSEANLIKRTSLIIWDEAPMMHRYAFEAVDRTFKDILGKDNSLMADKPFGGMTVVLGGDFRQILPVVPQGSKHDIIHSCISRSPLWQQCKVFTLTKNMRIQQQFDSEDCMSAYEFSKWVLDIGNGVIMHEMHEENPDDCKIKIPAELLINTNVNPVEDIISETYPYLLQNHGNTNYLEERAILTPRNEIVDIINDIILEKLEGEYTTYLSADSICQTSPNLQENESQYPTKFLNSLSFPGMPNHEIKLKVGTPIMLLRNLSPSEGLCNGTRLIVTQLLK